MRGASLPVVLGLLLATAATGCGGDSSGGVLPPSSCVTFQPSPSPPAPPRVVAVQGAGTQCGLLEVQLLISSVADFYGMRFIVLFDEALVRYDGYDIEDSVLKSGQAEVVENPPVVLPGSVDIAISRKRPALGVDVTAAETLVRLYFAKASQNATGSAGLSFDSTQVIVLPDGQQAPIELPGVPWVGGTTLVQ